jgi:hypothetical protein
MAVVLEARRAELRRRQVEMTAEDEEACWQGRARMARARLAAGVPLDEDDEEALRRHPS